MVMVVEAWCWLIQLIGGASGGDIGAGGGSAVGSNSDGVQGSG